jgi:hypothetical protein
MARSKEADHLVDTRANEMGAEDAPATFLD